MHRTIQAAGREAGYFVSSANLQSLTREELVDAIDHLRGQAVEGIVLISATNEALEVARAQEHLGIPVVVVEGDPDKTRWTVGVDQVAGAELGTQHLIDLGHTDIVHLAGPLDWTEARGPAAGLAQRDVRRRAAAPASTVTGDWSAASGYEAGREIAARDDVTAVFCANDQMALGLLRALHEAGRGGAGGDRGVSVVGFDDIPEAAYLIPPLTTVRQDFQAVGQRAIEILRAALGRVPPPRG